MKSKRGDDKSFPSESYGIELEKNQSAIGRVWATGTAELVSKPGDDAGFAHRALAKEFGIRSVQGNKITPTEHYVTPERRAYLKTLHGDDKKFGSESYGIELAKNVGDLLVTMHG